MAEGVRRLAGPGNPEAGGEGWGEIMIEWLNQNAGAVTAAATVIYAAVTLVLLLEARRSRQLADEAALAVSPRPWGDGLYLSLRLENYGPAIARDVRLRYWFEIDGEALNGTDVSYADPVFGPGRLREFLPGSAGGAHRMLNELAEQRHVLHWELSWQDDRIDLRRRRARHVLRAVWAATDLRDGFYTAHPLTDKELIPALEKQAGKLLRELAKLGREADEQMWARLRGSEDAARTETATGEAKEADGGM